MLVALGLALAALAPYAFAAQSPRGARASACSNVTVKALNGGKLGKLTLRFVLIGSVSCDTAHRLIRAYFHHVATGGHCEGTQCLVSFPGGWDCGYFFATESHETGGGIAGCGQSSGARIRVYWVSRRSKRKSAPGARSTASSACAPQTSKNAMGRQWSWRVVLHGKVSCAEAIRTEHAYIRALREGRCPSRICSEVTFPGGWTCSSLSAAEEKEAGNGLTGGCERKGASFKVYKVTNHEGKPGTLHLREFLSPDREVWCTGRTCGTYLEPPTRSAEIDSNGTVTICSVPQLVYPPGGHVPEGCALQNWNADAPILKYGQRTEQYGLRCTSATNGITCTVVAGAGKGKGFRIDASEAVEVG